MGTESADRARIGNEIYDHPLIPQTAVGIDPADGLPRMHSAVSMEDSKAPPLDPETFVCMGDESAFVIRDAWGDVRLRVTPSRARRFTFSDGRTGWAAALMEGEVTKAQRPTCVMGGEHFWYEVEPLKTQCDHYRRVMHDFENEHQSPIRAVERVCTAQRTDAGEYLSLSNTRVHACEHRSPRDFVSEERLRKFDQARVDSAKKTEEPWDPEAALKDSLEKANKNA